LAAFSTQFFYPTEIVEDGLLVPKTKPASDWALYGDAEYWASPLHTPRRLQGLCVFRGFWLGVGPAHTLAARTAGKWLFKGCGELASNKPDETKAVKTQA